MDKNLVVSRLEYEIKKTKWDRVKNQYLLKRIKENKSIYPSDKKYLEKLLKLETKQKPIVQKPIVQKPIVQKPIVQKPIGQKPIVQETIQKQVVEKPETKKLLESFDNIVEHETIQKQVVEKQKIVVTPETIKESKDKIIKVKQDPVIIGLTIAIFGVLIGGVYFVLGPISMAAMGIGGVMTVYYMLQATKKLYSENKPGKNKPSAFLLFLILSPFLIGAMIIYEGVSLLETPQRIILVWAMTISFFTTMLFVPLAVLSKHREDARPDVTSYPKISVIIPAYNEEKVITHTINGLLETKYPDKEIIFVDDGSTDKTLEIANQFKDKITILHKENGGKATALNYGIECSNGEIIVIVDADTIIGRNTLKDIIKGFDVHDQVAAVAGNVKVRNRTNLITKCQALEYITGIQIVRRAFDVFGSITIVPGALGAFRKSMLDQTGSYGKDTIVEDYDQTIKLLKAGLITSGSTKATAYTEAPNTVKDFVLQRKRWFRGNIQVFKRHMDALTNPRFGYLQKLSLPYLFLGMVVTPIIGLITIAVAILGIVRGDGLYVLQVTSIFVGVHYLMTALALRIDNEDMKLLPFAGLLVFGYKQIVDVLLLRALIENFLKTKVAWTSAKRIGVENDSK